MTISIASDSSILRPFRCVRYRMIRRCNMYMIVRITPIANSRSMFSSP
jgi:hypothetical protein